MIGLIAARCKNKDIKFNVSQIKKYIDIAKTKNVDYIFFGESFLQGFDSLCWDFDTDKKIAVSINDDIIQEIREYVANNQVGVGFGYFELDNDALYSSYLLLDKEGTIQENYKRVSKGWKHFRHTDHHYKEGNVVSQFPLLGKNCTIALCGDLWDKDTTFYFENNQVKQSTIIWPVHVDFGIEEWNTEIEEYHKQALQYSSNVYMINNLMEPNTHGGAFVFTKEGRNSIPFDEEKMLIVDL